MSTRTIREYQKRTPKAKPKVPYSTVLTRSKKMWLAYIWLRFRVDPEWRKTPEYRVLISSRDVTRTIMGVGKGDTQVAHFFAELNRMFYGR
jgi:hypothetical protein